MTDFQITFQANELLHGDYEEVDFISKIMFKEFLRHFKAKTIFSSLQILKTLCCQGNVSSITNLSLLF